MLNAALLLVSVIAVGQADAPNVPKHALDSLGYYVGDWRSEWTEDGEKCAAEFTTKWVKGKYCTLMTGAMKTPKGVAQYTLISGWDALNEQIVDFSYASDGTHSIERWKIVSPKVEEARSTGVNAEGQATEAIFRIEKKDHNEFTLTITERKQGGQSKPDLTIHYKRSEKPTKPSKK